jgi:hypothetical protein
MKVDDPKLTAYAIGELPEEERRAIERQLTRSPEAQAYVLETQQLAERLRDGFREELDREDEAAANILPMPYGRLFWSERNGAVLAVAAALVGSVAIAAVMFWRSNSPQSIAALSERKSLPPAEDIVVEYWPAEESHAPGSALAGNEKPFTSVSANPVSILPMRVGSGSFAEVRKSLVEGRRPLKSAVRIEEMINHFAYSYPEPTASQIATLTLDAATCPWHDGHELVRIGVYARDPEAARYVELRFNRSEIESYRLLGYDETAGASDAAADEAKPRTIVTALYELIPAAHQQQTTSAARPELLTATVRRATSSSEALVQRGFTADISSFDHAPADFRFAAAVAEFGMLLRDSPYKGSANLVNVVAWADAAKANDPERTNFVELLRKSQSLL